MKILNNPIGLWTLFEREAMRFVKVWVQTLLAPVLSNIVFFGIFGGMFAVRGVGGEMGDYLSFLIPGLCISTAISSSFQNPSSSLMIQRYQGLIQDLNTYPLSEFEKTLGFVLAGMVRGVLIGSLTALALWVFAGTSPVYPLLFFVFLSVISFAFSCIGLVIGLIAKSFETISFVMMIVITPLSYLGGVFFEVTKLPEPIARFAVWNPFFPLVDATRGAYLGASELSMSSHVLTIVVLVFSVFIIAYGAMCRGIGLKN